MNETALKQQLTALARGQRQPNAPVVEAYLVDPDALQVARLIYQATCAYYQNKTRILPPSSCLPLLD